MVGARPIVKRLKIDEGTRKETRVLNKRLLHIESETRGVRKEDGGKLAVIEVAKLEVKTDTDGHSVLASAAASSTVANSDAVFGDVVRTAIGQKVGTALGGEIGVIEDLGTSGAPHARVKRARNRSDNRR